MPLDAPACLCPLPQAATEIFYRHSKFWKNGEEAPPIFLLDGVTYMHVNEGGVQLVATTRDNVAPSFCLECLKRICTIIKVGSLRFILIL